MGSQLQHANAIIQSFRQAAELNDQCPLREGNVVQISSAAGDRVVIGADLHGHRLHFDSLVELAALDSNPRRHLVMQEVCHGGPSYPSKPGGCMSHTLLEDVAKLKVRYGDRFHFLLSNHELAELTEFPILKGGRLLNLSFCCGLQQAYGKHAEEVSEAILEFLGSCPLAVRLENRVFISHSLPAAVDRDAFDERVFHEPYTYECLREGGEVFRLVWGRDYRPENAKAFAQMVDADLLIHGHDPCPEGVRAPNGYQVIIDSCCSRASYLMIPVAEPLAQEEVLALVAPIPLFSSERQSSDSEQKSHE